MPHLPSLLHELKRRKVLRVAAAYAVVAWGVVQVAATVQPYLKLPAWVVTLVIVLAAVCFPLALVLSWMFDLTPAGVQRTDEGDDAAADGAPAPRARPRDRSVFRRAAWFGLGLLVAASGAFYATTRLHDAQALDAGLVAVLPFRVAAADPSFGYLREGMLDLLAAKLTGEGGPRAVEPRALLSAWRAAGGSGTEDVDEAAALELARRLGAASLVEGAVVGTPTHVTLSAALVDIESGRSRAKVSVEGAPDSLSALVDRLAARLLAAGAGEDPQHLQALSGTPLPALRAYLDGNVAYRKGAYQDALADYDRAVELDSTFALAVLGQLEATFWLVDQPRGRRMQLAWSLRDRLSERDRALLEAMAGPPQGNGSQPMPASLAQLLAAAQRAVDLAPDRPEGWYLVGEAEFHGASGLGHGDADARAEAAFTRAIQLDSTYILPYDHLVEIAIHEGMLDRARALADRFEALSPDGDLVPFVRWRVALASRDTTELRRIRESFPNTSTQSLLRIMGTAVLEADGLGDAVAAERAGLTRAATPTEARALRAQAAELEDALGHPARALRLMATGALRVMATDGVAGPIVTLGNAIFGGLDPATVDSAERAVWPSVSGAPPERPDSLVLWVGGRTVAELRRIRRGDASTAAATAAALRQIGRRLEAARPVTRVLADAVDAAAAVARGSPDARAALERFDRDLAPRQLGVPVRQLDFLAAELWDEVGDHPRALAAIRRRNVHYADGSGEADCLREEGRLAALTGDRDGAIAAYRRYLALRSDPEPSVRPEVERVRRALAALVSE